MPHTDLIYPSPETLDELRQYVKEELDNHNMERTAWVDAIKRYDNIYWAEPSQTASQGPLKFGSTIVIPVTAIAIEMMQAKAMTKLFALEQFTAIQLPDVYADLDRDIERVLDHELVITADIKNLTEQNSLEFNKYGTCIAKVGYEHVTKKAVFYDEAGNQQTREVTVKKGICVDAVQCANYLQPFTSNDAQSSPWVGEVHFSTKHDIYGLCKDGLLYDDTYEKLETYFTNIGDSVGSPSSRFLQNREIKEKRQPLWPTRIDWQEIWLAYDIDGDGEKEEVIVYYHRLSDQILGIRYNYRSDLSRPYHHKAFFPVEGRWAGIGLCKMGDQFQIEITTQHRQRIDAGTLANLRMFKAKRGAGISPDERVYYGKIWMVDEIDDLQMFQIGEVYPSAYQNEQATNLWWQQRSGANELTLGMQQVGTPGTAASELARLQEANNRFDYTYNRFKDHITAVALDASTLIGQFGVRHEGIFATISRGEEVRKFLGLSPDLLKQQIIWSFKLAGQSQNKLLDRATWTQLAGTLTQYYTNMMQVAAQLGDQVLLSKIAKKSMLAGSEAMKQILESFETRNIERIVLTPEDINGGPAIQNADVFGGLAGIVQAPGMGYVNPINTLVGGGG